LAGWKSMRLCGVLGTCMQTVESIESICNEINVDPARRELHSLKRAKEQQSKRNISEQSVGGGKIAPAETPSNPEWLRYQRVDSRVLYKSKRARRAHGRSTMRLAEISMSLRILCGS
jgi:hypothetical protein